MKPLGRRALLLAAALLLATLAGPNPGWGQEDLGDLADVEREEELEKLELEELLETPIEVWTATKTVQTSYEAPAIITTVTREQMAVLGYRSIAELLGHLLGFYVIDDHALPNVAVRGSSGGLYSDSSIIKVLVDGHSIAFAPTGGNWLGPELIPLSAVDRIEIIRGPASALYGADAFLGVINIKTRDGKTLHGGVVSVAGGLVGRRPAGDVDLAAGAARGVLDVMVAFRRHHADLSGLELPGSSPAPAIPLYNLGRRTAHGLDQDSVSAIARVTLRPRAGSQLGVFAYYSSMERGAEFGSLFQLANGRDPLGTFSENRISQWQLRAGVLVEHELSSRLRLALRGAYARGQTRGNNRTEVDSEFFYVRRDLGFQGGDLDAHAVWTPLTALRLVLGASLLVDNERLPSHLGIAKRPFENVAPGQVLEGISIRQGQKTFVNRGAYLQGTWSPLRPWLALTGGLRHDQHNVYGGLLSGRIGLVSSLRPNLHAKLLHGAAFKAPSPLLLHAVPSADGDVLGNAELEAQQVDTSELQIVWEPGEALALSTDVALSRLSKKTEFVQQGPSKIARNVARATTWSWESSVELKHRDWLRAHASFELQRTVQRTGQEGYAQELTGTAGSIYPGHMVHGHLVVQPPGSPVRLAGLASYIGARRASGNNVFLNARTYTLPAYVLVGATLSTRAFKLRDGRPEVSFSLSGKNLLGATGPAPGFSGVDYPLAPRAFILQMDVAL